MVYGKWLAANQTMNRCVLLQAALRTLPILVYDISGSAWDFKCTRTAPAPYMLYSDQSALLGGHKGGAEHILRGAGATPCPPPSRHAPGRKRNWGMAFFVSDMCHFAHIWLVQFQFEISNTEHNLPQSRLTVESKLLWQWKRAKSQATFMVPKTQDWCKLNWNLPG